MSNPNYNYDWANVTKAEVSQEEIENKPRKPIPPGMYPARVSNIKIGPTKGGAFGVKFEYTITEGESADRTVSEFVCLKKKNGDMMEFGGMRLKRRLLQLNLTADEVDNFKFPKSEKDGFGDFKKALDATVTIETDLDTIKDGEAAGLLVTRVTKVFPKKADEAPAT